jgi:hypothetical protein
MIEMEAADAARLSPRVKSHQCGEGRLLDIEILVAQDLLRR